MKIRQIKSKVLIIFCMLLISITFPILTKTTKAVENKKLPALLCIDTPQNNTKVKGNRINISGWSLNVSGIKQVQVSVDNGSLQNAVIGQSRPDVAKVYPVYTRGEKSGYNYTLDMSALSMGSHKITVKSTGNNGAVTTQNFTVYKIPENSKKKPPLLFIDTPNNSIVLNDESKQLTVRGWALNGYGVQKVQVYFDGANKKDAKMGQSRPDVNKVFPGYAGGANSGYSATLDLPKIKDGIHTVKVVSIGNDGSIFSQSVNVKKVSEKTMPGLLCIDTPQNNTKVKGNRINISGWSLNVSGVKQVQVAVDNGSLQNAVIGQSRPDVAKVYPVYTRGKKSGYNYTLDMSALSMGSHKITVKSTGNNGAVTTQNLTVYKIPQNSNKKPPLLCIDDPNNSIVLNDESKQLTVRGWALNGYGVRKVQVYFDGTNKKDAKMGQSRPDVNKVFPGYAGGANSGYSATLDLPKIKDGIHTVKVVSIGNDGSIFSQSVNVKKVSEKTMPGLLVIDSPKYSAVNTNSLNVSGWSLDLYGIKQIQVGIDDGPLKDAKIGQSRPDVAKAFSGYSNEGNSGYNCKLDVSSLSPGMHTIKVISINKYGTKFINTTKAYKLGKDYNSLPQSKICIDTPKNNIGIKAQNYLVSINGWSLNVFGVKKVKIYLDNKYYIDAQTGISRVDVNNIYNGYIGGAQSGYKSVINISSLSYGAHTISVRSIGNDDSTISEDIMIYKVPNNTNVAPKLVSFLSTGNNVQKTEIEAVRLHNGDQHNNCVYFSSTALRLVGVNVPLSMANTKNYIPYLSSLGWQKYYNANLLYPGNIVFTVPDGSGYSTHTYVFMGWVDQNDRTKAYVADNQDDFIHVRSLIDAPGIDAFKFAFYN